VGTNVSCGFGVKARECVSQLVFCTSNPLWSKDDVKLCCEQEDLSQYEVACSAQGVLGEANCGGFAVRVDDDVVTLPFVAPAAQCEQNCA